MRSNAQQKTEMDAQSPDICTSFAADPEHAEVPLVVEFEEFAFVDGSDPQLTLHRRDQRRSLEKRPGQGLETPSELSFSAGDLVMKANHTYVFLSSALLRFHQSRGSINTDNQTTSDFWVKGATVASLFGPGDSQRWMDSFDI